MCGRYITTTELSSQSKVQLKLCKYCHKELVPPARVSCPECQKSRHYASCRLWWNTHKVERKVYEQRRACTLSQRYHCLLQNARRRNRELAITQQQFNQLMELDCSYCGGYYEPTKLTQGCRLDRVNNDLGYTLDNVAVCCHFCNRIKQDLLDGEQTQLTILLLSAIDEMRKYGN